MTPLILVNDFISDNATIALYQLLRCIRAKVTISTVSKTLQCHPNYPSTLALSDVLNEWHVDNMVLQLDTVEQLHELPMPFLAHLNYRGGWLVVVKHLNDDYINYKDSELGNVTESLTEFRRRWSGVILYAETNKESGEANYTNKRKQELLEQLRGPVLITGIASVLLVIGLNLVKYFTIVDWVFLLTKSLGLLICVLLVSKMLDNRNDFIDKLCNTGNKTNCNNILYSPGAKLWGWLSWTDIGLIYFAGGMLCTIMISILPAVQVLVSWLAILVLPYTLFSIYYQYFVVKQWCVLCVAVQCLLITEGSLALTQVLTLPNEWRTYVATVMTFIAPLMLWLILKPLLKSQYRLNSHYTELMKLWRDPKLFFALLMQQPKMPSVTDGMQPILLGCSEAACTITMVINPYCKPCANKYKELVSLLQNNADINAQIIFTLDNNNDKKTAMAMHMMLLNQDCQAQVALSNWYENYNSDYGRWANDHPVTKSFNLEEVIKENRQWLESANISVTPTLYINDRRVPVQYQQNLKQLHWLLNDIDNI